MIERLIKQVVLSPGSDPEMIQKAIDKVEPLQATVPKRLMVKSVIAKILHPLGLHYWVSWMTYDAASDRLVEMGLTCRFCPLGKSG